MVASKLLSGKSSPRRLVTRVGALALFLVVTLLSSCTQQINAQRKSSSLVKGYEVSMDALMRDLIELTSAPHPFGSPRQHALSLWLKKRAKEQGLDSTRIPFSSKTPNPALMDKPGSPANLYVTKQGFNVIGKMSGSKDCQVIIGSHYDTKDIKKGKNVGANDSASSSAGLFQLVNLLSKMKIKSSLCDILFVWFDGEESVLSDWYDGERKHPGKIQDNTYGSRHFASKLQKCKGRFCLPESSKPIVAFILLDMIGSKNLKITNELNSDNLLRKKFKEAAVRLGFDSIISKQAQKIEDDHIPFKKLGIPVLNVIDFENIYTWHTAGDTVDTISPKSIEKVIKVVALVVDDLSNQFSK